MFVEILWSAPLKCLLYNSHGNDGPEIQVSYYQSGPLP